MFVRQSRHVVNGLSVHRAPECERVGVGERGVLPLQGVIDCVEGARVRLLRGGVAVAETTSDNYGDFKFDKLEDNSGAYTVEITDAGGTTKTVEAMLGASINLGEIRL